MKRRSVGLFAALAVVAATVGAGAAGAGGSCAESLGCWPTGKSPDTQKPRVGATGIRIVPKVDSSGQVWRAGRHAMY